ncbi:unnamed protein product, partial [Hapterophycus canaliculatus]
MRIFNGLLPGADVFLGDTGASVHCVRHDQHVRNKRSPLPEEQFLSVGDGFKLPITCVGDLDLVLHCMKDGRPRNDVPVTLTNVFVVRDLFLDIISFNPLT